VERGQVNQTVARPCFRACAGSGLVIHCFTRFQFTPNRRNAWRTSRR
jgi:hypothetical protein